MTGLKNIGKYNLVGEIGSGGMGVVYQAYDAFMDRFVALKVPKIGRHDDESDFQRLFYNETNAASRLQHPHIIEVYDAGSYDELHYIAMEYVPGGTTLKRFCHPDNLLPLELIGRMLLNAAEAFDYAHRQGVMHRDIKPSNILLKDEREIKISDFGLALLMDPDLVDTQSTVLMGSPRYMAPERLNEHGATHQSDIYSLGVVMYELLCGRLPFDATHLPALTQQVLNDPVKPPSNFRHNLSPEIDQMVLKAMARDPQARYSSMLEFAADIGACFTELDISVDGRINELRTEQLKQLEFFQSFNDAEIWELLRWSEWLDYRSDEVVLREGDVGDSVYLVIKGGVDVVKGGQKVASLVRGEFFGEIAFMGKRRRSADVLARSATTLLKLNIQQIEQASKSCQIQFQRMFINTLIERLVKTTELLVNK